MISDNKTLDKVYTASNHEELMDAYKDWACDYEADTVDKFGYVAHIVSANALAQVLEDKTALILMRVVEPAWWGSAFGKGL